jgi:hypothetical protein
VSDSNGVGPLSNERVPLPNHPEATVDASAPCLGTRPAVPEGLVALQDANASATNRSDPDSNGKGAGTDLP